jgi:enoyl-CoA hydratase
MDYGWRGDEPAQLRPKHMESTTDIAIDRRQTGDTWITINRPHKHNALAGAVLGELGAAVLHAGADPAARLLVIRGAANKYFAAGGDLAELASVRSESGTNAMADHARNALDAIRACPVPVIAYVNGDALGGGAELVVACDLRMLESTARIGFVQGRLGITTAWGGGPDLVDLVGAARAMRMMARCEMVSAETALDWGLVDVVVSGGADSEDVQRFLKPFLERSPRVLRGIKAQAGARRAARSYGERRAIEREHLLSTWLSAEHWVASDRFLARDKT